MRWKVGSDEMKRRCTSGYMRVAACQNLKRSRRCMRPKGKFLKQAEVEAVSQCF